MGISAKANILIVDNAETMRSGIKEILKEAGLKNVHHYSTLKDAQKYIELCKTNAEPLELAIVTYDLPNKTGVDFYLQMKQDPFTESVPFMLVSGDSAQEMILKAAQAGIKNILLKPFTQQDLINEVAKLMNKKKKKAA